MNVTFATDGFCIAKMRGRHIDSLTYILFGLCLGLKRAQLIQRIGGKNSTRPGAKIFSREIMTRDFAQVGIYVIRLNSIALTVRRRDTGKVRIQANPGSV